MRKLLTIFLFTAVCSFKANEEKTYTLKLNDQQLQTLWYVVNKSNAEHLTVEAIKDVITKQLQPQMDTTKKK